MLKPSEKPPAKFSYVLALMNASMFSFTLNNALGKELMNRGTGYATFLEYTFVRMLLMAIAAYFCCLKLKV